MPQRKLVSLLKRLRRERDPQKREKLIRLGRKALMKWFLVGAANLLKGVIPLNKRDKLFVEKHRQDFNIISDSRASDEDRKKALLKRGGAGFLGGTIIRHLLKWEEKKKKKGRRRGPGGLPMGRFVRRVKGSPVQKRKKKRKIPPIEEEEEGEDSLQYGLDSPQGPSPPQKKSPKGVMAVPVGYHNEGESYALQGSQKKRKMMVRIPLSKISNAPIGASRTTDTSLANRSPYQPQTSDISLPSFNSTFGPIISRDDSIFREIKGKVPFPAPSVMSPTVPFAPTSTSTAKPSGQRAISPLMVYSSGEEFETPKRKGPNIKYTKRKLVTQSPPKRKGPNIKYTKRKSPKKKKSPKPKAKKPGKRKLCSVCGKAFNKVERRDLHEIVEHGDPNQWLADNFGPQYYYKG